MDRSSLRRDALKYFLFVALGTTLALATVVLSVRPAARADASAPAGATAQGAPTDEAARPFVLAIPCWEKLESVPTPPAGTRWLRITGKVCGGQLDPDAVTVTNETNHYQATIFPAGGVLTTDLIGLSPGANDLQITIAHGSGREVRHLALTR